MSNSLYTHGAYPATGASGSSAALRAELESIEGGFDLAETAITAASSAVGTSNTPAGNIAATNVQAAINELDSEKAPTSAATATGTSNTPAGNIAATNVQAAINELDTEKAPLANPVFSGNVGVGMTSTGAKLDVNGMMRAAGWSINGTGVVGGTTQFSAGTVSTDGNWGYLFKAPTASGAIALYEFADSAGVSKLRIDAAGNVIAAGNVGAGSYNLNGVTFVAQSGVNTLLYDNTGNVCLYLGNSTSQSNYYDNTLHIFRSRAGTTERMRIDATGNVGIGTSANYAGRLTVVPATTPTTVADAKQIQIGESSGNAAYRMQLGFGAIGGGVSKGSIQVYDNNIPADLLLQGAGGNVGIGLTPNANPGSGARLQVLNGVTAQSTGSTQPAYIAVVAHDYTSYPSYSNLNMTYNGRTTPGSMSYNPSMPMANTAMLEAINVQGLSINANGGPIAIATYGTEKFRVTNTEAVVTAPVLLGYGPGAGGTVTQATSKGTEVRLDKPSGVITTAADALGAGAITAFNVNNTLVTVNDTFTLTKRSTVTDAAYDMWAIASSGKFAVYIKNISAGSLSEAIAINFTVIKGATT